VEELQQKAGKNLKFSPGYTIAYGGTFENLNEAKARLGIAVPISLVMIFFAVLCFWFCKTQFANLYCDSFICYRRRLFSGVKRNAFQYQCRGRVYCLIRVAVLNGIVLISEFNRLKKDGVTNTSRIVLMGTKIRLRPVLMTAFVASLGFLPMALSNGQELKYRDLWQQWLSVG
jgi:cobalt-zinc-cadmium resistance protein CzcA